MSSLLSTAPYVWEGFEALIQEACEAQELPTSYFDYELAQLEPAQYIILTEINPHVFEWEGMGTFEQKEHYTIRGYATIFNGDSPATNPGISAQVRRETYALFNSCVMSPAITNRNAPIVNHAYPVPGAVYLMLPGEAAYKAGVGEVDNAPAGWIGRLDFTFDFSAIVSPE